jgi:uncharacterized membrane protein YsdA (DUF1294 family)
MNFTFFDLAVIITVIANLSVFLLYGFDKWRAGRDEWRVPERTLLFSAFLAPFGALSGMVLFRHKIRKVKFFIIVPFFAVLQGTLIVLALS